MSTPIHIHYRQMKPKYPDAILLFRVGDFYETFSNDAKDASDILGITLTFRDTGDGSRIELAGFPHHALDSYFPKLVLAGRRVAICEDIEKQSHKRKVVRKRKTIDYNAINVVLTAFFALVDKLYIFDEIRTKTAEIRRLAGEAGISPLKAFEECSKLSIRQASLFD